MAQSQKPWKRKMKTMPVAYTSEHNRSPTVRKFIPTNGQQKMQPTMAKTESSYLCNCNTNVSHGNCILIGLRTKGRLTKAILDGSAQIVEPFPTCRKTTTRERVWRAFILSIADKYSTMLKNFRAKSKGYQNILSY